MDLHVDDDAFVRAPADVVYRRLTNLNGWPAWWPGVRVARLTNVTGAESYAIEWGHRLLGPGIRLLASARRWRHEVGFELAVRGDLEGRAEFWLEPGYGGTVVHHLLVARSDDRRPLAVLARYRAVLRRGLWAFKDDVQSEMRTVAGLAP